MIYDQILVHDISNIHIFVYSSIYISNLCGDFNQFLLFFPKCGGHGLPIWRKNLQMGWFNHQGRYGFGMIYCLEVILLGCWGGTADCSVHKWTSYVRGFSPRKVALKLTRVTWFEGLEVPICYNLLRIIRKCTLTWMSQKLSKWLKHGLYDSYMFYVITYNLSTYKWGILGLQPHWSHHLWSQHFLPEPGTSSNATGGIFRGPWGLGGSPFCWKLPPQKSNQTWRIHPPWN